MKNNRSTHSQASVNIVCALIASVIMSLVAGIAYLLAVMAW